MILTLTMLVTPCSRCLLLWPSRDGQGEYSYSVQRNLPPRPLLEIKWVHYTFSCNFEKTQVPLLRMTEQLQILYPRLECTSRDLKGLWIASKRVFSLFGRKPSLGAPDQQLWKHFSTRWSKEVNKQCKEFHFLWSLGCFNCLSWALSCIWQCFI